MLPVLQEIPRMVWDSFIQALAWLGGIELPPEIIIPILIGLIVGGFKFTLHQLNRV